MGRSNKSKKRLKKKLSQVKPNKAPTPPPNQKHRSKKDYHRASQKLGLKRLLEKENV